MTEPEQNLLMTPLNATSDWQKGEGSEAIACVNNLVHWAEAKHAKVPSDFLSEFKNLISNKEAYWSIKDWDHIYNLFWYARLNHA